MFPVSAAEQNLQGNYVQKCMRRGAYLYNSEIHVHGTVYENMSIYRFISSNYTRLPTYQYYVSHTASAWDKKHKHPRTASINRLQQSKIRKSRT